MTSGRPSAVDGRGFGLTSAGGGWKWPALAKSWLLGLLAVGLLEGGCAFRPSPAPQRFEFTQPEMGVPFRVVVYAPHKRRASLGAQAAFARIRQLNDLLSDYDQDSELSRLSRTSGSGQWVPVSPDLWRVLTRAQEFAVRSQGAFDITVGPYVNLWRRARREGQLPDPGRLAQARPSVGYQHLKLDPRTRSVCLAAPRMRLDLGGIAKGYALEEAVRVLRAQRLPRTLVTGGGDMVAGEPPPGKRAWRIEVAPLDATNAPPPRYVLLRRRALATSGDLFQRLEIGGRRYSHIVDPRTGIGLTDHALVTVIAKDGMTADALSTAVSVLGPAAGFALVEHQAGAAATITRQPTEPIEVGQSRGFRRFLEPTR